ncbi:MAG TPA: ATP-binding protein [Candidatus Dormibacteraeota bacterium]|nr:ATP-binding protein [Candidatus Dormibacteraeota bacterium]
MTQGESHALFAPLSSLIEATKAEERASALCQGARAISGALFVSTILFVDDTLVSATHPESEVGFRLRDGSHELRRLFLHALARFDRGGICYIPREKQRALAGVSTSAVSLDLLFVPLLTAQRTVGVVALGVEGDATDATRSELLAFCGVATYLLDTARALAAARRLSRDSQLLAMVNERLHKSLDRRDVLAGIVGGVRTAFNADHCTIFERSGNDRVVPVASSAPFVDAPTTAIVLDGELRKVFSGLAARRDDFEGQSSSTDEGARSVIGVPFLVDGKVENALLLESTQPHAFDDGDLSALRSLAFHVGLALSNARLYERERARRTQAESLERVVRILRDTQYVDEVLLVFVVTTSHELPIDCFVYVLEGEMLVRRAMRSRDTSRGFVPSETLQRAGLEPFLVVDDPSDSILLPRSAREALFGDGTGLVIPLRIDGNLWGLIAMRSVDGGFTWPQDERAMFVRTLASHLEIALANAHAYERERRRAQERETLAEAARTILGQVDLPTLAEVMSRLAAALVHAEQSCVLRWCGDRYVVVGSFGEGAHQLLERSGLDVGLRVSQTLGIGPEERRVQRLIENDGFAMAPLLHANADASDDSVDAFLLVGKTGEERFGREQLRLLQEVGALLALALRNLELYSNSEAANRALHESNQFKDDLLAMLAHDFRGPLTVIEGYCELLLETAETRSEEIETIYGQAKRLVRLAEDALALAQSQGESFALDKASMDFAGYVATSVDEIAPNNPRIQIAPGGEGISVELDGARFRHVLDNLISNALKYSGDEITIRVGKDGAHALLEVSDHGIGVPEADLSTVFSRFGRGSNARNRGIAGSGIGLYVAKKIVEAHRGNIRVRSKENEGSTFTVELPLLPTP